jgi:glycosyltransferase involved in cell wall biosynthesis
MRVLYCTDTFPPQVNGVSVVTSLSVEGLRARGWDVHVVAPRYPAGVQRVFDERSGDTAHDPHVTSIASASLPIYPDIRLAAPDYSAVSRAVTGFAPDLVHCATEFVIGRLGQMAAARAGVPFVSSYHTDFGKYAAAYGMPWLVKPLSAYLSRFHLRARRTYTPSGPARDDLWRIGVRDVEVWGRGVDAERFHPSRRSMELRGRLGLGGAFTFLYVGRLAAEKGVDIVFDAYRRVEASLPPGSVRLVIAGEGPEESRLRAAAPNGTVFLGYLDRARELPALYASADAFVFASTTETLGLVVLEAMASGIPVVAAPAGGVADHLRDGRNGLSYAPRDAEACADAMRRLYTDRDLTLALRDGARRTAEALTWDMELDRLDRSYREVCAETSAARAATPAFLHAAP